MASSSPATENQWDKTSEPYSPPEQQQEQQATLQVVSARFTLTVSFSDTSSLFIAVHCSQRLKRVYSAYRNLNEALQAVHRAWDLELAVRLNNGSTYTEETEAMNAAISEAVAVIMEIKSGNEPSNDAVLLNRYLLSLRVKIRRTRDNLTDGWDDSNDDELCAAWWHGRWSLTATENEWVDES